MQQYENKLHRKVLTEWRSMSIEELMTFVPRYVSYTMLLYPIIARESQVVGRGGRLSYKQISLKYGINASTVAAIAQKLKRDANHNSNREDQQHT